MSKRQASLFKYGFTKKVKHRNTLVNVSVGDYVHETGIHTCSLCDKSFNIHKDCMRMFTGLILLLSVVINRNLL